MARSDAVEPWELLSSESVTDYGVFTVRRDRVRSPRTGSLHDFQVLAAPDGVTVVALTPDDELVLVEQYRHGTRVASLETPSGLMDEGEDPGDAARRELREETGYEGDDVRELGVIAVNPAWETTRAHVMLLRGARPTAEREQDPGEDVRVRLVPRAEVWSLVRAGEIDSAVILAALLLLRLEEDGGGGRGGAT